MYICMKVLLNRRYIFIFPLKFLCNIFSSSLLNPCGNKKCIFLDEATVQAEPFCSLKVLFMELNRINLCPPDSSQSLVN